MQNIYFVILCGGSGTRLWPLSRKNRPKQLIPFLNNTSLLEQTIDRITPITASRNHIGVITIQEQTPLIEQAVGKKIGFTLAEPSPRNTGPAILYSCLEIAKKDPNALIAFLPADHFIPETEKYRNYLNTACHYAETENKIVTLGLMPTHPATGYGYIQTETNKHIIAKQCYPVEKFREKPSFDRAQQYIQQNNMFWNLGMFVAQNTLFIEEFKTHAPDIFNSVSAFVSGAEPYETTPSISIDYAIMEKSTNIAMMPCDFEWHDVGNLNEFLELQQKYAPSQKQNIIQISSTNNIAQTTTNKLVTFIGVDNIRVVEDNGVLVIAKKDAVEKIKEVLPILKKESLESLL